MLHLELVRSRGGSRLELTLHPKCRTVLDLKTDERCGRPAVVRVNWLPHWSMLWCAEHAAEFGRKRVVA